MQTASESEMVKDAAGRDVVVAAVPVRVAASIRVVLCWATSVV